jgi:flagellar hook protein FlgE
MRIESALYAGREGLQAHGQAISVVGDNISNSNTVAFKESRIEFSNLLEIGSGVQVQGVRQTSSPGVIESTGRSLDAAIAGGGYFVVGTEDQQLYTRAGNFSVAEDGTLVDASGKSVLGYKAESTTLDTINLYNIDSTGAATTSSTLNGNLSSSAPIQEAPANPATFAALKQGSSFIGSMTVYDSLGQSHDITVAFTKTAAGNGASTWIAQSYIDGGEVGGTAGTPVQVGGNATLTFGSNGSIEAASQAAAVITGAPAYGNGAAAGAFTIDFSKMTQFSVGSQVTGVVQDGQSSGSVKDFRFDSDGSLYAILDSGSESFVARLPVATFRNVDGLERIGSNHYVASDEAGDVTLANAGVGNAGQIDGSALERSTVDLAAQFVDLVLYQRGYQASSQTLSTASELIKNTIALMR